jgi:uncharacterized oligopeptide transporter (OPT) family protein
LYAPRIQKPWGNGPSHQRGEMTLVLGLICGWAVLNAMVVLASYTDSEWANHVLAAGLVVGVAINGAILMLP